MKLTGKAIVLGLALAGTAVVACSSGQHGSTTSSNDQNQAAIGSIGMALDIPPGVTITSVDWTITQTGSAFNKTGTVVIGNAQSIEFVVGGLPAGGGYSITLKATDSHGDNCLGTATFTVIAGAVSSAGVNIVCTQLTDAATAADVNSGSVAIDAGVTIVVNPGASCPGISSFSISPAEEPVGKTSQLTLAVAGPTASILWTQSGVGAGTFSDATAAAPVFTCTAAGDVKVTATVSLPGSSVCTGVAFTTISSTIHCEPGTVVVVDAGADSTTADTGSVETGATDSGTTETGTVDSTIPSPCAPNNGGAGCTATEQLFVNKSLDCYSCLVTAGCLNDSLFTSDVGHECSDVPSTAKTLDGTNPNQSCLDTITCTLANSCAKSSLDGCFCGDATGSACLNAAGSAVVANGKCLSVETNGLNTLASDPTTVEKVYTDIARPAGQANTIFQCAGANSCTSCLQ